MKLKLVFLAALALAMACEDKQSEQGTPMALTAEGPPLPAAPTGQLIFDVSGNVDNESVKGYIVGRKDELVVAQAPNGTYYINDVPPGNVDIVVTGALIINTQLTGDSTVGLRKNRVLVTSGSSSSPGALSLYPLGSITGKVKRGGSTNHEGIFVSIPGTDFGEVHTTDAEGNYSFADVPSGHHRLLFQSDGYRDGRIEDVEVKPSRSTTADELVLGLSTGPDGSIVINGGALFSNTSTVSLALNASADTELMKISEDINFSGLTWEPVRTYRTWTFSSAGKKALYVKFADANGLETSPAKAEITIDLFSSGSTAFVPGFTLTSATAPANQASFQLTGINVPPQATSMLIYDLATIDSAVWVAPATSGSISYTNAISNCGSHTIGVKFKSPSGDESEAVTRSVGVNCFRDATAAGAPPVNSSEMVEVWTGSRLLMIGGGVATGMMSRTDWSSGYQYDATADAWSSLPTTGQPSARSYPGIAYVADKLFIWGGASSYNCTVATGNVYTESTQTWSAVNTSGAPTGRCPAVTFGFRDPNDNKNKVMVWAGSENGSPSTSGAIYSIPDNSWSTMATTNGPTRASFGTIVTGAYGDKLYMFGGGVNSCGSGSYNYGESYNVTTNIWAPTASPGSLLDTDYCNHINYGFFDGTKFYLFTSLSASSSKQYTVKGATYNPATNTWAALPMTNGPLNRTAFSLTYTGSKIVVLGGLGGGFDGGEFPSVDPSYQANGFSFDLASQTWTQFVPFGMYARANSRAYYLAGSGIFSWHGKYYASGFNTSTITHLLANPP